MILIDVNILVIAVMTAIPGHPKAKAHLDQQVTDGVPIGLPWAVLMGFVRITTNPRIMANPLTLEEALFHVQEWLALPNVSILHPTEEHARHFADQCRASRAVGNLVSDAHLAALAIEHGCAIISNDGDFAKFAGIRWSNPL